MFVLNSNIEIGEKKFNRVHSVEIQSDSKRIEDIAVIKLPTTARLKRAGEFVSEVETAKTFAVGDEVKIQLGYDGELIEEFHGYVKQVHPNTPLEIECEDSIYPLKRKNLKKSFRSTTLEELIEFIIADTNIQVQNEIPEIKFTHFYFRDISGAKALQKLKDEYGLTIYFKSFNQLFIGLASDDDGTTVKYQMGRNVIDHDLKWVDETDVKLQIKAVNILPDNTQKSVKVGDDDGEKRTLFFYDLDDADSLKQRAQEEILKYKFSGYRGGLKTFFLPNAKVGNVASIDDPNFAERNGNYLIEKVVTTFGQNGARRKVEIGLKV